jgi:hypothetical protein
MGFHSATFGIVVSTHNENRDDILRLIAKSWTPVDDNDSITVTLFDDIVIVGDPTYYGIIVDGNKITFDFEELEDINFCYREDPKILISQCYCCHFMIHLGSIGDEEDSLEIEFENESMSRLMNWKQYLSDNGRLAFGTNFKLVGNCCS